MGEGSRRSTGPLARPSLRGRAGPEGGREQGRVLGRGGGGRRRDALEPARKQQEKIPRFFKITRTSLPRSERDKERGTAPHNKLEARRASVGGGLHPRPS